MTKHASVQQIEDTAEPSSAVVNDLAKKHGKKLGKEQGNKEGRAKWLPPLVGFSCGAMTIVILLILSAHLSQSKKQQHQSPQRPSPRFDDFLSPYKCRAATASAGTYG